MPKINHDTFRQNAIFSGNYPNRIKFLESYNHNPTVGSIIKQEYVIPKRSFLQKTQTEKYLERTITERINSLYPRTKGIREYIVKNNRLKLDIVTQSKGYKFLDRLKIFLRVI